jgi:hypothetical protein
MDGMGTAERSDSVALPRHLYNLIVTECMYIHVYLIVRMEHPHSLALPTPKSGRNNRRIGRN